MKAEVIILGLFTFEGENERNIVFNNNTLHMINTNIENSIGVKQKPSIDSKWVTYYLNQNKELLSAFESTACTVVSAEMGYYHHRVIFRFTIESESIHAKIRDIREILKSFTKTMIGQSIILPNQNFGFKKCDTYQLFIVHEGLKLLSKNEDPVFSNDTTTMAFDITEPRKILPVGKKYNIRISIPSTIIYTKSGVSDDFLKAMINSIYQYCLYANKKMTKAKNASVHGDPYNSMNSRIHDGQLFSELDGNEIEDGQLLIKLLENEMDEEHRVNKLVESEIGEDQLVDLWHHIIDTMGGRTLDKNMAKISQTNYVVAFIGVVIAVFAIDFSKLFALGHVVSSNLKYITGIISSLFH